jgi:hypothetical protein
MECASRSYFLTMQHLAETPSLTLSALTPSHLRPELLARLRALAVQKNAHHAWSTLSDEALLTSAGLGERDGTGRLRFTLAGVLLLGNDETLQALLPSQGTVAIFRPLRGHPIQESIQTNLLEARERLLAFAARYLPEGEALPEGDTVRDRIFGELFLNSLIHRDPRQDSPARFVVESKRVFLENPIPSPTASALEPSETSKTLTQVFQDIGWLDPQQPSALDRWGKSYFGLIPMIFKSRVFRILAPFPGSAVRLSPESEPDVSPLMSKVPWQISTAAQDQVSSTGGAIQALLEELGRTVQGPVAKVQTGVQDVPTIQTMQVEAVGPMQEWISLSMQAAPQHTSIKPILPKNQDLPGSDAAQMQASKLAPAEAWLSRLEKAKSEVSVPQTVLPGQGRSEAMQAKSPMQAYPDSENKYLHGPLPGNSGELSKIPGITEGTSSASSTPRLQGSIPNDRVRSLLTFCQNPRYRSEMQAQIGINNRDYFRKEILNPLIAQGLLRPTLPDKPNSPKQQYLAVAP